MIRASRRFVTVSLLVTSVVLAGCGGGQSSTAGAAAKPASSAAAGAPGKASNNAGDKAGDKPSGNEDWKPAIKTASLPADPCELIAAADVEAIMGNLAAPPRKADGCLYTLVVPETVAAKRQKALEMQEKIRKAFGGAGGELGEIRNADGIAESDPRSYAVTVSVDVRANVAAQAAADSATRKFGLGDNPALGKVEPGGAPAPGGWDDARRIPYGFMGRVGHVQVAVEGQSPDVPREPMLELAARVRDRIPDLPFAVTNPYQVMQLGPDKDPCSLLTRAEVEAVLGPLAIDPYRSSSYWPPLAHGQGHACAYYSAGHHVFAISPQWQGGAESFKIEKGIGGLVGLVAPQQNVVIKGPWDQSQTSNGSGALLFLKGDRLLQVYYTTSRASQADAIKLAAFAMPRLEE